MQITKKNIAIFAKDESLNSYEFWKILNNIRNNDGVKSIQHGDFLKRVEDEIDDLPAPIISEVKRPQGGTNKLTTYQLNKDQMLYVGMRESKSVRKAVGGWLKHLSGKVNELEKQKADRAEASLSFKEQSAAVKYIRDLDGKECEAHHFSNEANLLNRIVLGRTAANYRATNALDRSQSLRDTLSAVQIEAFIALRKSNEALIRAGLEYSQRQTLLKSQFDKAFKQRMIDEMHLLN